MADNINSQGLGSQTSANPPENNDPFGMAKSVSPLEQSGESQPSTTPSDLPPSPTPPSTPPATPAPQTPPGEVETASTPDTDAFLESILKDNKNAPAQGAPEQPVETQPAPATPTAEVPQAPTQSEQPAGPTPTVDTGTTGLETTPPPTGGAPPETPPPGAEGPSQPISNVPIGGVSPEPPKKGGGAARLLILAGAAAVVIIGGYIAFTKFFSAPKDTSDEVQVATTTEFTSVVPTTSVFPTVTPQAVLTKDDQRKQDLATIQQALIDYRGGSSTYPVSENLVFLTNPNNPLQILVTMNYLTKLPQDPDSTKQYAYRSDGNTFRLSAVLDNASDPSATIQNGLALYLVTQNTPATNTASNSSTSTLPTTSQSVISSSDSNYPTVDLNAAANQGQ